MSNDRRSEPSVTQPVTLQQIASELGVSTATVSLALRGSEAVARATVRAVRAACSVEVGGLRLPGVASAPYTR